MIHEETVTYEVCKLAKKKGFNEKCYHYYQNGALESDGCFNRYNKGVDSVCSAPTQSLLQRWLREEKRIDAGAVWDNRDGKWIGYVNEMDMPDLVGEYVLSDTYVSYELALEDALKYVIEKLI